jgi:uncharacterized membrane protein
VNIGRGIKRSIWRGLAALLPALLTFIVLKIGISLVQDYMGQYVNWAIIRLASLVSGVAVADVEHFYGRYWLWWLGLVLSVAGLCVVAYLVGTFIGSRILRVMERSIVRLPVLRRIYPGAKQISDFLFSEKAMEFRRVVAVEYPRKGLWSLGFVTGRSFRALSAKAGREFLSVFMPSTPTPVTGFVVSVPSDEVVDIPISVDEAFQYLVSAGVIMPPAERLESLVVALQVSRDEARATLKSTGAEAPPDPDARTPPRP